MVTPSWLDLREFRDRVGAADRAARRGDRHAELEELRRGLRLWRGPIPSNVASEYRQALRIAREDGDPYQQARALDGLAHCHRDLQDRRRLSALDEGATR